MFELHITCTKDIDKLEIDFADGTSVIKSKPPKADHRDEIELGEPQEVNPVKVTDLPKVPDVSNRDVKIDSVLDNLEI